MHNHVVGQITRDAMFVRASIRKDVRIIMRLVELIIMLNAEKKCWYK